MHTVLSRCIFDFNGKFMVKTTSEKMDFSVYNDYIKEQRTIKITLSVIEVCSYKLNIHKNNLLYVLSI